MLPDMTAVTSSNIAAIGYNGSDLFIRFHSGATWKYAGVPAEDYSAMLISPSVGKYFNQHIRSKYQGEPLREKAESA